jgi:hypothetical protein
MPTKTQIWSRDDDAIVGPVLFAPGSKSFHANLFWSLAKYGRLYRTLDVSGGAATRYATEQF